ncbi:substrate-binding domain-containing protein [Protaetiibacter intestinalis]|uniref:LacI family transcriptional regulator n=1 Tax=Protaetiibacter intestinalis TaxID=2419774 RepID=A0A387B8B4_9MICO|nr:substrate-binding domain-containing protein [Protaetiibacter intestinalis]AYF97336.1 LacI family transcriptional regulator [Protaetiibacter intestinalis]
MGASGDVAVITPASGPRRTAGAVHDFASRLRVHAGGYGHGVRIASGNPLEVLRSAGDELAGAVLLGFDDELLEGLPPLDLPVVAIDSYAHDPWFPIVRSDDDDGGRAAARHLLSLGHRRIAFAGPRAGRSRPADERRRGFEGALADAGLRMRFLELSSYGPADGARLAARLARTPHDTSAVLLADETSAAGLVGGLVLRGSRVPEDVSVVCFADGLPSPAGPRITSVTGDPARRSRLAADALFGTASASALTVGVVVIDRATTAAPAPR